MPFDYDRLINYDIPEVEQTYTARDTMLYALGLNYGEDQLNRETLRFCYEKELKAVPSMVVVLGRTGWASKPETGIDYVKVLHGEQGFRLERPLPPSATVKAKTRVADIIDKGPGKGALIYTETVLTDAATGERLASQQSTTFARGDGGCGGPGNPQPTPHAIPDRAPDHVEEMRTLDQSALIYRLSGDYNPLHSDPDIATKAGFEKPILHGLCTFGVTGHGLLKAVAGYDTTRFKAMQARFTSPVYPGETIRVEMWVDGDEVSFRSTVVERDKLVLNNGRAEITG